LIEVLIQPNLRTVSLDFGSQASGCESSRCSHELR
jgi:hypothetical protein